MMQDTSIVITIDGPSGAGKGTVAQRIAHTLGFHLLDSGAVYRSAALHAIREGVDLDNEAAVLEAANSLDLRFEAGTGSASPAGVKVFFGDDEVTDALRNEQSADAASRIATMPGVRAALLQTQRSFRREPGLVADGRDMGTVVFPDASLKIFLTASAAVRAERRHKQLNQKGIEATLAGLMQEISARDLRDSTRKSAPLVAAKDALVIDSTGISVDRVTQLVLQAVEEIQGLSVP